MTIIRYGECLGKTMDLDYLRVEAYAGYKGEETPRAFVHEGMRRRVEEVVARWYTDRHCYFRVSADDGYRYVLRFDLERSQWELVMQEK